MNIGQETKKERWMELDMFNLKKRQLFGDRMKYLKGYYTKDGQVCSLVITECWTKNQGSELQEDRFQGCQ